MIKSVRLNESLESRLRSAAARLVESESQFIRSAIERRCEEVLGQADDASEVNLAKKWTSIIGVLGPENETPEGAAFGALFPDGMAAHSEEAFAAAMSGKEVHVASRNRRGTTNSSTSSRSGESREHPKQRKPAAPRVTAVGTGPA